MKRFKKFWQILKICEKFWKFVKNSETFLNISKILKLENFRMIYNIWYFQSFWKMTKNWKFWRLVSRKKKCTLRASLRELKIDIIKFAIFSYFWGLQSNDGSRYQKILWTCSLDYKSLLNCTCLTMKFHNPVYANV